MWFRNLYLYQLVERLELTPEALAAALELQPFQPCGGLQAQSVGWVSPYGREGEQLVHASGGCLLVCLRREERLLPASVIKEAVDEKAAEIEARESRSVSRKERSRLKDEVLVDLLPRAFTRSARLLAYLDLQQGWLLVDSASANRAEELVSLLRESLGSLRARPLASRTAPAVVLTQWLQSTPPADFLLKDECELRDPGEDGGVVRCRRQALDGDEVGVHLAAGKQAVRLAVEWNERLGCVLGDDWVIRRLRFLEGVQDEAAATEADDPVARLDADFTLMTLELRGFLQRLIEVLGGLPDDA